MRPYFQEDKAILGVAYSKSGDISDIFRITQFVFSAFKRSVSSGKKNPSNSFFPIGLHANKFYVLCFRI